MFESAVAMNPVLADLGRRAVECEDWQWRQGMLCERPNLRLRVLEGGFFYIIGIEIGATDNQRYELAKDPTLDLPNFSDAATLGCLLELVRGRHGVYITTRAVVTKQETLLWTAESFGKVIAEGGTEAEVLVAALEAEPTETEP